MLLKLSKPNLNENLTYVCGGNPRFRLHLGQTPIGSLLCSFWLGTRLSLNLNVQLNGFHCKRVFLNETAPQTLRLSSFLWLN